MKLLLRGQENVRHERFLPFVTPATPSWLIHVELCYRSGSLLCAMVAQRVLHIVNWPLFQRLAMAYTLNVPGLSPGSDDYWRGRPCCYTTTLVHGRFPVFASMLKDASNSLRALCMPSYRLVVKRWVAWWLGDHPELKLTTFCAIDIKRRIFNLNDISVNNFFDRLEAAITEKNISSSDVWNTDETGF